MKLKKQFLRLFALLGLSMAATTTAWAADEVANVELQGNAQEGYFVNMPKPVNNKREIAELPITISDAKSFKVYDDGGATDSYTASPSCNAFTTTFACSVNLVLTAPEDYLLSVTGSLKQVSGVKPYLIIYNGNSIENSPKLITVSGSSSVGSHLTSGRSMSIQFYTAKGDGAGDMELIIDLVPVNLVIEQSGTSTFNPVKNEFEVQVPAAVGDIDNTTTLIAPEGYVLYMPDATTPNGGSMTVDGNLSSTLSVHVTTESSGFASALNVPVHVLKKTTSTTAIDIYTQDDNSYAVAKITDGEYEGAEAVSIPNDVVVNAIEYDREFTVGTAATIVLPFGLDNVGASTNAKFFTLKDVVQEGHAWMATMKKVSATASLAANTPYAVKIQSGNRLKFSNYTTLTLKTGDIAVQWSEDLRWFFTGSYVYRAWAVDDEVLGLAYGFAANDEEDLCEGGFGRMGEGSYIAPMRAYLSKANPSVMLQHRPAAKGEESYVSSIESMPETIDVKFIDEDEKPMGIGRMNTVTGAIKIDRWFDLKGRSTNHKPTTKGAFFNKKGIAK